MPPKTERQRRFMGMCSTPAGRKKAEKECPPMAVAKEMLHGKRPHKSKKSGRGR